MENRATAELINIIRTLFYNKSDTNERDRLVKHVEKEFQECDKRIDMYIRNSSKDLSRLIKVFNDISNKIENSRHSIKQSREALKQCKNLLLTKRDDVRRLLIEYWEQKSLSENVNKLNDLYMMPDKIRSLYYENKQYYEAAKLISDSIRELDSDYYKEIAGLIDIKRQIENEKINLEKYLFKELNELLYSKIHKFILYSNDNSASFTRDNSFKRKYKLNTNDVAVKSSNDVYIIKDNEVEELIEIKVKSIVTLDSSTLDKIFSELSKNASKELLNIINLTSSYVVDLNYDESSTGLDNNPKLLLKLLELVYEQFKLIAKYYKLFIKYASKTGKSYNFALIWNLIQTIMVQLLEQYLDVKLNDSSLFSQSTNSDINSYFVIKKRFPFELGDDSNVNNSKIFSFKGSLHSMNVNKYMKEKNNELALNDNDVDGIDDDDTKENRLIKILVCQPSQRNITTIYSYLEEKIIREIHDELSRLSANGENILEKFLNDFILNKFIQNQIQSIQLDYVNITSQTQENANQTSQNGLLKYEISKQLITLGKQRELNLNKPILHSTFRVNECCYDLFSLMKDISSYSNEFIKAMILLLDKHLEHIQKLFQSVVKCGNATDDSIVYSMNWVQDDSINKYFKQLPSFSDAIKGKSTNGELDYSVLSKEVETLINNFDCKLDDTLDIITNYHYIEMIAHIHESLDWLIQQLRFITLSIDKINKNPQSLKHNQASSLLLLNELNRKLNDFDLIRSNTLLLLYLETRVHCFYHLQTLINTDASNAISYSGDLDTDPDEFILQMNRDLHRIHEHLQRSLSEIKVNYVFDALGFMLSQIFIRGIKNIKKMSQHGIAKMLRNIFNIEQNLSAIRTKSDPYLMKAHKFYELLYKKPEELLEYLQDHNNSNELIILNDYINLLNLIYRSQPGYEINSLSDNILTLTNILSLKNR